MKAFTTTDAKAEHTERRVAGTPITVITPHHGGVSFVLEGHCSPREVENAMTAFNRGLVIGDREGEERARDEIRRVLGITN